MALPPLTQSSERETKYAIILLISVFVVLIVINGFRSGNIVEWSDVERIAIYDEYATFGSTITIEYYLVNDRPVDIKVERILTFTTSRSYSSEPNAEKATVHIDHPSKYIIIPANDRVPCGSETINITKTGQLVVQKTTFPDVLITILEVQTSETQFNVTIGLNEYVFDNQDTARLIITNKDAQQITFGSPYFIKKLVDEEWVKPSQFPLISGWDLMLHKLPVGKTTTQEIKIDTLESGHYRVIKKINHERTQTELTFTLEFDIRAQAQWEKIFGGTGREFSSSVQITDDDGYIIIGNSNSFDQGRNAVYLGKTDSCGNLMWEKIVGEGYGGSVYSSQVVSDGGYIITGLTSSRLGEKAVYLLKTDSNGVLEWENTFNGTGSCAGWSVQVAIDGGYIIAGYTKASVAEGGNNVYLVKTDLRGELEWEKYFGGTYYDRGYSVQVTGDGGYIIAGETESFGAGKSDVYLIKTNSNGELEWNKTYGGPENDIGWCVQVTSDGGYIIAGLTDSYGVGGSDVYLVKTDSNGDLMWEKAFGRAGYDRGYCVQVTDDGGYVISGFVTASNVSPGYDVYLVKTDSNGDLEWEKTFGGSDHDAGWCVQVTNDGGYILTGTTSRYYSTRKEDILLIKFKPE